MLPNGGRFNEGQNTSALDALCREKAAMPGPGQYDQRPRRAEMPRGGRFSLGDPKSDVEWMIYAAERQPRPGQYAIRDPRMIGIDVWGGKFNEARPETDVERKIKIGKSTPGPGDCEVDRDFQTSGGKFNMSNPKTEFDFLLDRAKAMPGPDTYNNPRWPCPAGGRAQAAKKLDRYRAEGAAMFPKQPAPVRRVRSLNDVSPFRATVTARQSNYVRPAAPQRAAQLQASSSTGALVMQTMSDYIRRTKSKVVDVFHFFDKDGSGELDAWELREALAHLGLKLEPEQVVQAMKEIDANYDGTIDIDEFMKRIRRESIAQRARSRAESPIGATGGGRQSMPSSVPDVAVEAASAMAATAASGEERANNGGTPASYTHHLSMARPSLQPDLHSVDWGGVQVNAPIDQRYMHKVERQGEEFALDWDAKTRQLRTATEAVRLLELADRRDDALKRFTTKQHGRLSMESQQRSHFVKVDRTPVTQLLPGPTPSVAYPQRHSPMLDASARFVMPTDALTGPSHLSPLALAKSQGRRARRVTGGYESNGNANANGNATPAVVSELDAFERRVGSGSEYSITSGPWPSDVAR